MLNQTKKINTFEMLLLSAAAEEAEKAGDESANKDYRGRGENLILRIFTKRKRAKEVKRE